MAAHKLSDIKGLDAAVTAKLNAAGIASPDDLVAKASARAGREALAKQTGISISDLNELVNRADLLRLKGVGMEFANLLEECGVDSCKELQHRVPANLQAKMKQVNDERKVTHHAPTVAQVESWVKQAGELAAA